MSNTNSKRIAIWAGIECTINRVADSFHDQCQRNGHSVRIKDLEMFARLGIERLRYPFLWETVCPNHPKEFEWSWLDERAHELLRLGLTPIAGLIHHGSGPKYTNLLDPQFPELFASYAEKVAERYPWITDYTPVNEPLTTARFSGLYGFWYPHHKSDSSFVRALYNQTKATILAMKAIRKKNSFARLIQTEDLGYIQGTDQLKYQVHFENERRWLSFDLLCGRVDRGHFMYEYLNENGLTEHELKWLVDNPCSPSILGLNHYLLSNRFLDHRLEYYPKHLHGGNWKESYADVGAVDTTACTPVEPGQILRQAWDRYKIPLAITEVHLHGTREAQIRWLNEVYNAANRVSAENVDIRAITAWSLLGSFDWNKLCTVCERYYESGIFNIRSPEPRPTALAKMVQSWTSGNSFDHPVLRQDGWWHSSTKLYGPKYSTFDQKRRLKGSPPLLIVGSTGTLGRAFARVCERRDLPYRLLGRKELDITNIDNVREVINQINPWAIINSAGYVRVDQAETEKERCYKENVHGPKNLAEISGKKRIPLIHFSSDLVFDGSLNSPYLESHPVAPLNTYGHSKAQSEKLVLDINPKSLVVRTSSFFGPWDKENFVFAVLQSLAQGQDFYAASDLTMSPTYIPDLVDACLDLLIDGEKGLVHLTNKGHLTWLEWANISVELARRKVPDLPENHWHQDRVISLASAEMNLLAKRPVFSALNSERVQILPSFENAFERYFHELEIPFYEFEPQNEVHLI